MIDAHHHLGPEPDYADRLVEVAHKLGFTRVCLVGLPAYKWPWATNEHVQEALRRHPDFFSGFAYVDPAVDPPEAADRWREAGFAGLKLIRPRRPYDDPSSLPLYARAAGLGMPLLFHTGMVSRTATDREHDVHSIRMRPVGLDYIARQVPEAALIGAHLGHPWWREAGETCRLNANVYADLSGPVLRVLSTAELRRVLWWEAADDAGHELQTEIARRAEHESGAAESAGGGGPAAARASLQRSGSMTPAGGAWAHVVFGSDVHYRRLGEVLDRYRSAMALEVPATMQGQVLSGTMRRLLRLGDGL